MPLHILTGSAGTGKTYTLYQKLIDWSFGGYDDEGGMHADPVYEDVDLGVFEFEVVPGKVDFAPSPVG